MATPVIMPRQGQSVESCIITKWYKKKGVRVEKGDLLFSYETDKASFEEEAGAGGILLGVFFEEGDDVPCLANVCVIGSEDEDIERFRPDLPGATDRGEKPGLDRAGSRVRDSYGSVPEPGISLEAGCKTETRAFPDKSPEGDTQFGTAITDILRISPRARNLALKAGVDYRYANTSGPQGRIVEKNIAALKDSGRIFTFAARDEILAGSLRAPAEGTGLGGRITTEDLDCAVRDDLKQPAAADQALLPYEEIKLSNIRKVIAKTMFRSLSEMAQLTLNTSFDATAILEFRKKVKEGGPKIGLENITINDIILFAVSRTLVNHPDLNAHLVEDRILRFRDVNLGVAVDTARGLMVPTLFKANGKSLDEISREAKCLAKDCQAGTIKRDFLKNGSFTVTNLGVLGIESFTPVINPPQTGILGVNCIVQRPKEADGGFRLYPAMGLSLTFDHRAVDGAPAARFLQELGNNLEYFNALLAR